jgi:non-specific serine/threonine protein kinase
MTQAELKALDRDRIAAVDLVITSYGSLLRVPALLQAPWRLAILDEAQAIKTPGAKQTRAAKQIDARARIALSGTPVENRLADLWSIFDFLNPGLLGSGKAFSSPNASRRKPTTRTHRLRWCVRILRRLKTDKAVIADLPDKTSSILLPTDAQTGDALSAGGRRLAAAWNERQDEGRGVCSHR